MKKIGIIFAMEEELKELLNLVKLEKKEKKYDIDFYYTKLGKKELILVQSGIGKVNAARATQMLIDLINPDYIFNIGVAGSLSDKLNIGDIVIGEKLVQHDFNLVGFGRERGFITNVGDKYIKCSKELVDIAAKTKIEGIIHKGIIASGDIFVTDHKMSKKISDTFNALCVEMEGAAIAQVCYLSKVPFIVIRSISDSPDGSDNKMTFDEFLKYSSKKVATYLKEIINNL